ncbi:MAG: hypothetical protein U0T75_10980 [Chitinophagales bacterium]
MKTLKASTPLYFANLLVFLLSLVLIACRHNNDHAYQPAHNFARANDTISICLDVGFQQDSVQLIANGQLLLNQRISTNYSIGVAGCVNYALTTNQLELTIKGKSVTNFTILNPQKFKQVSISWINNHYECSTYEQWPKLD